MLISGDEENSMQEAKKKVENSNNLGSLVLKMSDPGVRCKESR
jgi:hypothetical protein